MRVRKDNPDSYLQQCAGHLLRGKKSIAELRCNTGNTRMGKIGGKASMYIYELLHSWETISMFHSQSIPKHFPHCQHLSGSYEPFLDWGFIGWFPLLCNHPLVWKQYGRDGISSLIRELVLDICLQIYYVTEQSSRTRMTFPISLQPLHQTSSSSVTDQG